MAKISRSFFHKQSEALGYISAGKQTSGGSLDPKTQPPKKTMLRRIFFGSTVNMGDWFPSSIQLSYGFPRFL